MCLDPLVSLHASLLLLCIFENFHSKKFFKRLETELGESGSWHGILCIKGNETYSGHIRAVWHSSGADTSQHLLT